MDETNSFLPAENMPWALNILGYTHRMRRDVQYTPIDLLTWLFFLSYLF
jgi:hypothetical protein